jgi:hypothetical protein
MRLIDADELMEHIGRDKLDSREAIMEMVKNAPTVEPKRGKWILNRSGAYCCSECMEPCAGYVMMQPRDKFCKMCGADMRQREEQE